MSTLLRVTAAVVVLTTASRVASANEIVIETPGERSGQDKVIVGSLAGAGAIVAGIGLWFHLDSRSASSEISAHKYTGRAWTADEAAAADRADSSRRGAMVGYTVGGALLVGAIVALIVTDPGSETTVIKPRRAAAPVFAPTHGGALLGGTWSF